MSHKPSLSRDEALCSYISEHDTSLSTHARALYEESCTLPLAQRLSTLDTVSALALFVRLLKPRRLLEIGTFTGFATLAMTEAAPKDAIMVTVDKDASWHDLAARHWRAARVHTRITYVQDDAHSYFTSLPSDTRFDFIFIDADKGSYLAYLEHALSHLAHEGVIVIDNTLWRGLVCDVETTDKIAQTIRTFNQHLASDPNLTVTVLPVGDGLTVVSKH